MDGTHLHLSHLLQGAAARRPDHPAIEDERGRTLTYAALAHAADRLATRLARWGVGRGDRVGLFLPKGIAAVAAVHGILKRGAAYVPVDPTAPPRRSGGILADAGVKAAISAATLAPALRQAWPGPGPLPRLIVAADAAAAADPEPGAGPRAVRDADWDEVMGDQTPAPLPPEHDPSDLAYILYTSGSTGQPKGVMHTHSSAFTFLDWCAGTFATGPDDRFASHAPLHFDLSVFDLFVACRNAATLVVIGETLGKDPARLGAFLAQRRPSVWYSAPSILALLATHGGLDRIEADAAGNADEITSESPPLQRGDTGGFFREAIGQSAAEIHPPLPPLRKGGNARSPAPFIDGSLNGIGACPPGRDPRHPGPPETGKSSRARSAPRLVLFAGEVFPIAPLRRLRALWPEADFWNLYGPTETNVCTAQAIPQMIPEDRTEPYPIGRVCAPLRARVVDAAGRDVAAGTLGELLIAGPTVMRGYFGQPALTAQAFLRDARGEAWYRTGDLVMDDGQGCYTFHGRRDRMIKKRGYRIELGEIESALQRHEGVEQAAVVAQSDDDGAGVAITAFVAMKPEHKKSIIAMKRHCTVYLPHYMVPDAIAFLPALPTTSTDKIDYQGLKRLAEAPAEQQST